MSKQLIFILVFVFSCSSNAKVAYIPLFDAKDKNNTRENTILAIDLENGHLLKSIEVGNGVGAVFLNLVGDKLYASAENDYKIALIDTSTLKVIKEWTNLAVKPQQIILNNSEDKLYFAQILNDTIYQIDLITNEVSIALTLSGFVKFWYSENLNTIMFKTNNTVTNTYQAHFYDLNDLHFNYIRPIGNTYSYFIDEDGLRFYYPYFGAGRLYSLNSNNTNTNWYFFYVYLPGPIGGFNDIFANVFPSQNNTILAVGWHGTYEIDRDTGVGNRISALYNYNNPYQRISRNIFLKSSAPQLPFCSPPAPPVVDCENFYPLRLTIQNHDTNQEHVIFEIDRAGTRASGRYIGEKLYTVPVIPILNTKFLVFLLSFLILVFTYKTHYSHR